jgi:hypothetical protein
MNEYSPTMRLSRTGKLYPPDKSTKHKIIREKLFNSFEEKEHRYYHHPPAITFGNSIKDMGLKVYDTNKAFRDKQRRKLHIYKIKGKHGVVHAEVAVYPKDDTVEYWKVH